MCPFKLLPFVALGLLGQQPPDGSRMRNVAILVWDGVELIEFAGPAQIFQFTPGLRSYLVSERTEPIRSYFVTITPEYTFDNCPKPDVIVVPAGLFMMKNEKFNAWLRKVVPEAEAVLSVCNGSVILANAGVLDGHKATAPNGNLDDLRILGKNVTSYLDRRFVEDGKFITADSYFAGVDAALHLVRKLLGEEAAQRSAKRNLYEWDPNKYGATATLEGVVPKSRRFGVYQVLMKEGLDAAVVTYQRMVDSGEPGYSPPLDQYREEDLFRWLGWNLQNARRYDEALKLCQFSTRVFDKSAMSWSCLGEALVNAGRPQEALPHLFQALDMQPGGKHALRWLKLALNHPRCSPNDETTRARKNLRANPAEKSATIAPDEEPGERIVVTGKVRDESGQPVAGALVYAFHTDARGYYSPGGMDESSPRLFAYLRTGAEGEFELDTIRPGHYPDETEPVEQHIHFEVLADGYPMRNARMGFADDPFWVRHNKPVPRWAPPVDRSAPGPGRLTFDINLKRE